MGYLSISPDTRHFRKATNCVHLVRSSICVLWGRTGFCATVKHKYSYGCHSTDYGINNANICTSAKRQMYERRRQRKRFHQHHRFAPNKFRKDRHQNRDDGVRECRIKQSCILCVVWNAGICVSLVRTRIACKLLLSFSSRNAKRNTNSLQHFQLGNN